MTNKIILKKSSVVTDGQPKIPLATDLEYGELAINYAAGRLFFKRDNNIIDYFDANNNRTGSATTSSTTQFALVSFSSSLYGSGEFLIQATQGNVRHITKILVVHNGTTAIATEYGSLLTGDNLYSVDVDINSGNVRVLITPTSATSTVFKASYTLIGA